MADFPSFWAGFCIMLISCVLGFLIVFYGGYVIDTVMNKQADLPGADSAFAQQSEGQVYWFVNLFFMVGYCIPILGWAIFGLSILKRQQGSQYIYR